MRVDGDFLGWNIALCISGWSSGCVLINGHDLTHQHVSGHGVPSTGGYKPLHSCLNLVLVNLTIFTGGREGREEGGRNGGLGGDGG